MSNVFPAIRPLVKPPAGYLIICPFPLILSVVYPQILALAIFLAIYVLPYKKRPIWPCFLAQPMLQVVLPVALILRTIRVHIQALAMGFVIPPAALINLPFSVGEDTLAASPPQIPHTFISRSI